MVEMNDHEVAMGTSLATAEGIEPQSLEEARRQPDWPNLEAVIHEELASLKKLQTWTLVDKPTNANVIGSKWVFRAKKNTAGDIEHYKA